MASQAPHLIALLPKCSGTAARGSAAGGTTLSEDARHIQHGTRCQAANRAGAGPDRIHHRGGDAKQGVCGGARGEDAGSGEARGFRAVGGRTVVGLGFPRLWRGPSTTRPCRAVPLPCVAGEDWGEARVRPCGRGCRRSPRRPRRYRPCRRRDGPGPFPRRRGESARSWHDIRPCACAPSRHCRRGGA